MTDFNVAICIPTRDVWKANFGVSLFMCGLGTLKLLADLGHNLTLRLQSRTQCSILKAARADLVNTAKEAGCTHVLFLDDDMGFPPETLAKLLLADKDVIGLNCPTKSNPPVPTARDMENNKVYTTKNSTGLQEVRSIGCAVMLIKLSVFEKLKKPWFDDPWLEGGEQMGCEVKDGIGIDADQDRFFCRRVREAGISVWIDHDLSKKVQHIGDWFYIHQMMDEYHAPDNVQ